MLCNGILKWCAGTAPILLHDTLCIFDRKVGNPFPPLWGGINFFQNYLPRILAKQKNRYQKKIVIFWHNFAAIRGEGGVSPNQKGFNRKKWDFLAHFVTWGLGSHPIPIQKKLQLFPPEGGGGISANPKNTYPFLEESKQKTVLFAALNGLIFWAISLFWPPPPPPSPWMESFCDWVF